MVALLTMPNPSGTVGAAAREHATWLYSGITAHTPIAGAAPVGGLYWSRNEN